MIFPLHSKGARSLHEHTVRSVESATQDTHVGQCIFWASDEPMAPKRGKQRVWSIGSIAWILAKALLIANQSVALVAYLPAAGVATEKGRVTAASNKRFEPVSHRL
jgi:hypothetical protein